MEQKNSGSFQSNAINICKIMLLLTVIVAILPATFAVKCYTCSWSPKDAPNRTVMCNDEFFEGNAIAISECENGCQTYFHMDRNGLVEQVRRSCLQVGDEVTGNCVSEENKAFSSKRCTCNYNLCNMASSFYAASSTVLLFIAIFVLQILNHV
ncbi:uncharacterized protein TNIN_264561 [Trichonephila inaurata madagascariensis]|uniref:Protein sleepless n=1 Tax=Trichonephila inaurata madagascariensis TaxID=2747483 RepID=A0A8X6MHC5_9ARAC|nr:uncharacterized protein TNIN_264561 [Trichonephila inaurata madagascariensis]